MERPLNFGKVVKRHHKEPKKLEVYKKRWMNRSILWINGC